MPALTKVGETKEYLEAPFPSPHNYISHIYISRPKFRESSRGLENLSAIAAGDFRALPHPRLKRLSETQVKNKRAKNHLQRRQTFPLARSTAEGIPKAFHQETFTAEAQAARLSRAMLCPIHNLKS